MSLILEALRKSEAERRLGQAPDVLAPMPVMHGSATPSRRPRGAIVLAVLALSAVALAGWWMLGRSRPAAEPNGAKRPVAASSTTAAARPMLVAAPPARAGSAPVPVAPTQVSPAPSPASSPIAASVPTPAPQASPRPATARAHEASAAALASATRAAASLPSYAGSAPAAAIAPAPSSPTTAAPAPATGEPALVPVAALSPADRADLPALKVTMHVYTDDPSRRFMIIDGQRAGEGARLGEGVMLVRIRRDGAEIDAHGRHLLLPNP